MKFARTEGIKVYLEALGHGVRHESHLEARARGRRLFPYVQSNETSNKSRDGDIQCQNARLAAPDIQVHGASSQSIVLGRKLCHVIHRRNRHGESGADAAISDGAGAGLPVNPAIRNLIRDGKVYQIQTVLRTGSAAGMITMESSLKALCDGGLITYEDVLGAALDPREPARLMGRS